MGVDLRWSGSGALQRSRPMSGARAFTQSSAACVCGCSAWRAQVPPWRRRWAGREMETAGGTDGGGQADRKRR